MSAANRRWFRWSLRTMFVAVALCGTGVYWMAALAASERARHAYERAHASYEAELTSMPDVCRASLALFQAQEAVPFANRNAAALAHLQRIEQLHVRAVEGPAWDYDIGDAARAEVASFYSEAQRLASESR